MGGHDHSIHTFEVPKFKPMTLKRVSEVAMRWTPSALTFGAFSGVMFLYFTDWKLFMDKIPFYRKKFEPRDPII